MYSMTALLGDHSRQNIPPINKHVTASHIGRRITCQIEVQALDLLRMTLSSQRRHAVCFINATRTSTHLGIKESGRDNVHTCKFPPFASKGFSKVGNKGLGGIVNRLINGDVDNFSTHAGCEDEISEALAFENLTHELGAVDDAVDWR